jgi:hypothetical protein
MPTDKLHHRRKHRRSFATSVQATFDAAWKAFNNHDMAGIEGTLDPYAILLGISGQQIEAMTKKGVAKYLVNTFPKATFTPTDATYLPASDPITVNGSAKWVNPDTNTDETIFYNFLFSSVTGQILVLWAS